MAEILVFINTLEPFVLLWDRIKLYTNKEGYKLEFTFVLSYMTSNTSQRFLEILNLLEDYQSNKKGQVVVNWYYKEGDSDMLGVGKVFVEYAKKAKLKFNLISH